MSGALELAPRAIERPSDDGWTLVGTLDGSSPARVDGAGLITPFEAGWSLDWWIGADDRWYLPAREPTVRQRRIGSGPVLETTVRIPSGDARQTVYGALVGGRETIVVEVENDSPVPVALAIAIRPYTVDGTEDIDGIRLIGLDDRTLRVGTGPALVLPRPPGASGGSACTDVLTDVLDGRDLDWELSRTGAVPNGVLLYPLPHRTSLRFLLVPGGFDGEPVPVSAAPDRDDVARGWSAVVDGAARLEFPDPGLTAACNAARARLLLAAPSLATDLAEQRNGADQIVRGLALGGHHREAEPALGALAASYPSRLATTPEGGAALVEAVALAAELAIGGRGPAERPVLDVDLVEVVARFTGLIERAVAKRPGRRLAGRLRAPRALDGEVASDWPAPGEPDREPSSDPEAQPDPSILARRGLARLARLAGDPAPADQLDALAPVDPLPTGEQVVELLSGASSAGSWDGDDAVAAGRFVAAARGLLIGDDGDELVLLPTHPTAWRGGATEVIGAPTRHGTLSFALRWHGPRPALLWELEPSAAGPVTIRCPALDPDWSTTERRGETLLVGTSERLPPAPMPGDSFS